MDAFQFDVEDDEQLNNDFKWGGKDATIFLIDVSSHESTEIGLKCSFTTISRKITSGSSDLGSVILYNSKNSSNSFDFPNIYVVQDISMPSAERILQLENFVDNKSDFDSQIGSEEKASLHDVFWVCRSLFNSCKTKLSSKCILMFTDKDDPIGNDDHKRRQAVKGAKDLFESNVQLEILPTSATFNSNKFYKDLLLEAGHDDIQMPMDAITDPTERLEELLEKARRLEIKQRTMAKTLLTLAPDTQMGIKVFSYISKKSKPTSVKLYKALNEEVVRVKKEFLDEKNELLLDSDFSKQQSYGGKKLNFALNEVKHMSEVYDSGIQLLGFRPLSSFKFEDFVNPAYIIYPDDQSVKGSTSLFACLHDRCLKRKICPLVRFKARQNSDATLAFLLPQEEKLNEATEQIDPAVFYVCHLPFADDYRNIEVEDRVRAQTEQVDAAKDMIRKVFFKYAPQRFPNPALQTHWRNVETLALNRSYLEPVPDYTVPNNERIDKKAGELMKKFKSLVFSSDYNPLQPIKKRPPPDKPAYEPKKKPRNDDVTVEEMARDRKVEKLNMNQLKAWLQPRGVKVSGKKKQDLVDDVYRELKISP